TGTTNVCVGFTTTFSDPSSPGVWSTLSPSSIAIVGSSSGIVSGVGAGIATISYTMGHCSVTTPVTVNSAPPAITGSLIACVGATNLLSDLTGGGTWSSSSTGHATIGASSG